MDDVDRTAERQEREADFLIKAAKKQDGPVPVGSCYYCNTHLSDKLLSFCDAECRDAWQYEKDRKRALGL